MSLTQTVQHVLEAYNAIDDIIARAAARTKWERVLPEVTEAHHATLAAADARNAGATMKLTAALIAVAVGALAGAGAAAVALYLLP